MSGSGARLVLYGLKFGRLRAIEPVSPSKRGRWIWQCDCGEQVVTEHHRVFSGETTSCGCHRREAARQRAIARNASGQVNRVRAQNRKAARKHPLSIISDPPKPSTKAVNRWDHRLITPMRDADARDNHKDIP